MRTRSLETLVEFLLGPAFKLKDYRRARQVVEVALDQMPEQQARLIRSYFLKGKPAKNVSPYVRHQIYIARQVLGPLIDAEALAECCEFIEEVEIPDTTLCCTEVGELLLGSATRFAGWVRRARSGEFDVPAPPRQMKGRKTVWDRVLIETWKNFFVEASKWKRPELVEKLQDSRSRSLKSTAHVKSGRLQADASSH